MKVFLKISLGNFYNASRNKRELSVVNSFNTNIIVMAKGKSNHIEVCDGYIVHRRSTRPLGNYNLLIRLNRLCSIFTWAHYARGIRPYCISCHDIIALFIGWLSTLFLPRDKKPKLVYDSHEYELERNTEGRRNKFTKYIVGRIEKYLMNKCAFSIMVNDSIADEVQRIHKLKKRPVVVRNIPNYWTIDESICKKKKQEFCEQLGVSKETFLVMYHGGIMPARGIEKLMMSSHKNENIAIIILGYGEEGYINQLKQLAERLGISKRILFHESVPINELWQYVGAVDVGVSIPQNICLNHYYMLPNKLFESIQSLTPVIGSDYPEIRRIIKGYDIGLCVNPESADDITNAIEDMRMNKEMYSRFKSNLKRAKEELCWENERKILEAAYGEILR